MVPELMASFHVSVAAVGSLSACYFYAYAIAQIPVGFLIDRYKIRTQLTFACLLITLGSVIFGLTKNMILADISRVGIGLGSAFAFVGCLKLGSLWFPAHKFAFIVGLTNLLGVIGAVIGGKPSAYIVDLYGWRHLMLTSTIAGIIITYLLWIIVKEPKTTHSTHRPKVGKKRVLHNIAMVLHSKQTWFVAAFGGFMVAPIAAYSELWGTTFLVNAYALNRPIAAQITTLTFLGIALGGPTIGWLSDHYRKRKIPMLCGSIGALCSIAAIIYGPDLGLWTLHILHFTFGFFSSAMLLCFSLATEATTVNIRGTSIALTNTIIMAMGATLQAISGILLDSSRDFNIGFTPIILCYVLALICFCFIRETNCRGKHDT